MKNVLQDQSYLMHIKSDLYDTYKERYSQQREAVVNFDAFVALLSMTRSDSQDKNEHDMFAVLRNDNGIPLSSK